MSTDIPALAAEAQQIAKQVCVDMPNADPRDRCAEFAGRIGGFGIFTAIQALSLALVEAVDSNTTN